MRLSEAIRDGGREIGQERQVRHIVDDGRGGHCALGAAFLHAFGDAWWPPAAEQLHVYLRAVVGPVRCPACETYEGQSLMLAVVHVNNEHDWTFEQIADWVQAQEAIAGIGIEAEVSEPVLA